MRYIIGIIYFFISHVPHNMNPIGILYLLIFSLRFNSQYWYWDLCWYNCVDYHKHFVEYKWLSYFIHFASVWIESCFNKFNVISSWNILFECDPLFLFNIIFSSFLRIVEKVLCASLWYFCLSILMVIW